MKFIAHDPYRRQVGGGGARHRPGEFSQMRSGRADILSVSVPLSPVTHHLVNAERLALMKPTAYLINTARGPIVDQKALTRALQEHRIAGAGLDVLEGSRPTPTIRSSSSTTLSWRRTRSAGPTSVSAGNGAADVKAGSRFPTWPGPHRCSQLCRCSRAGVEARLAENRRRSPKGGSKRRQHEVYNLRAMLTHAGNWR